MVTYSEYSANGCAEIPQNEYDKLALRAEAILSALCGSAWSSDDNVCKMAVIYQIEFIVQKGGLSVWLEGSAGAISGKSYSIGGESESITYLQRKTTESEKTFHGLVIAPLAWMELTNAGKIQAVRGVRVW